MNKKARSTILSNPWPEVMDVWLSGQTLLPKVARWGNYQGLRPQNNLQHSYSLWQLMRTFVLSYCAELPPLDDNLLYDAALIHDHGEGEIGKDTVYKYKNHEVDLLEYKGFRKRYSQHHPNAFREYHRAFLLQFAMKNPKNFPREARDIMKELAEWCTYECYIFDTIERWDYVMYAMEQYSFGECEESTEILVQVLRNQMPRLEELADKHVPVFGKYFWTLAVRSSFQDFLSKHEGKFIETKD